MKVLFIDDHNMLRESLSLALQNEIMDFEFLQASSGKEAEAALLKNADCSVLLLDLRIGNENGLSLLAGLRKIRSDIRTLVCTAFCEPLVVENAMKMNIQGFISKNSDLSEIATALRTVAQGKEYFCAEAVSVMKANYAKIATGLADSSDRTTELFAKYKTLSKKEREIFELLSKKVDPADIAAKLGKSIKTVENQRTAIYAKMNVHDRLEIVEAGKILGVSEI